MTTSDKTYIIAENVGIMQILIISVTRLKNQYSMSPSKYRTANS